MGTGFAKKKKEQKMFREKMEKLQQSISENMESAEVVGTSGNGLVKITLSGTGEMKTFKVNLECCDPEDIEGLEALVKAAHQDAFNQVQKLTESNSPMGQGMPDLSMFGM